MKCNEGIRVTNRTTLLLTSAVSAALLALSTPVWAAQQNEEPPEEADPNVFTNFGKVTEEITPEEAKRRAREEARQKRLANRKMIMTDDEAAAVRKAKGQPAKAKAKSKGPAVVEHTYLEPSQSFLLFFRPWRLKVGRISFLQNTVKDLMRHHSDCRVVPAETKNVSDIVACPNTHEFGADGDEVVFEYLKENDVLCGADYFFNDEKKARAFARLIVREIEVDNKTFEDASGNQVDSPLFRVAVQDAENGALVRVTMHFRDEIEDFEHYGRPKITSLNFGELKVGKTLRSDINVPPQGSEKSACVQTSAPHPETSEFYGECFSFPYESHYQLNFDHDTGLLESIALTPYGVLSSNLVENSLIKKYGEPQFCEKASSDVRLVRTNRVKTYHKIARTDAVRTRRLTVYAGSCEKPIVFAADDRYVFLFDRISPVTIERDFLKRRSDNEQVKVNRRELDRRRNQLNDFF